MPLEFDADGTFSTVPDGDNGRRKPTQANLDALGGVVLSETITLDDAEIKALGAVSDGADYPLIVPQAPVGYANVYLHGFLWFHTEAAYTAENSLGYLVITQPGTSPNDLSNGVVLLNANAGDWFVPLAGPKQFELEFVEPFSITADQRGPIRLGSGFNSGPYGGGDPNNFLTVTVFYAVLPNPLT